MAIERVIRFEIKCDMCGTDYGWYSFDGITEAVQTIRGEGWGVRYRRGRVIEWVACPEHNDFDNG
jgi:hypothetical protein